MSEPGGKGTARRPCQIDFDEEALRWELLLADEKDKPALEEKLNKLLEERPK